MKMADTQPYSHAFITLANTYIRQLELKRN